MHPLSINAAANAVLSFATGCIILGNSIKFSFYSALKTPQMRGLVNR
uniref:Uncharacterized protein n=1 Tax=Escherichia coli TaxID=562 RepID=W8CTM0_ECOLX|nr:hypothetical protein B634_00021 [Escherichia coli]